MKVLTVVGARPQFIKSAPVSRTLQKVGIQEIMVHTGQHYDQNMPAVFFQEPEISEPNINLAVGSDPHGQKTGEMLMALENVLPEKTPNWLMVYDHRENVRWGLFFEGHIDDRNILDDIFNHHEIQAALHFAAFAYVCESVTDPKKYYQNNLKGTIGLLEALIVHGVNHIIFSSSCATYIIPGKVPVDENHPQHPINPYGKTKWMVEEILKDYSSAYPIDFMSLRYFNAAGADIDAEIGEDHDPETHLIPLVFDVAKGRSNKVNVFGTDYDTPYGSCIRDYIHVTDLVDAHVLALEKLLDNHPREFINLGTDQGYSVLEVIETVSKVTGVDISYDVTDRRPGDPVVLIAANDVER